MLKVEYVVSWPGKGQLVPHSENSRETLQRFSGYQRWTGWCVNWLGGTRASPMAPLRLHQPAAASAGKEMVWQSTSKGTGIAFIASTWSLGRALHYGIIYVTYANSDAPGRHLARATLSQHGEDRGRCGTAAQWRCSRTMSPKAGTVSSFIN